MVTSFLSTGRILMNILCVLANYSVKYDSINGADSKIYKQVPKQTFCSLKAWMTQY